jgi:hypothetical protein
MCKIANPTDSGVVENNAPEVSTIVVAKKNDNQNQSVRNNEERVREDPSDFIEFKNNEFRKGIFYTGF